MYLTLCVGKHMSASTYINDGICYGVHDRFAFLTRRKGLLQDRNPVSEAEPSRSSGGDALLFLLQGGCNAIKVEECMKSPEMFNNAKKISMEDHVTGYSGEGNSTLILNEAADVLRSSVASRGHARQAPAPLSA